MSEHKRKSITFLSRSAPYGKDNARTALDLVLASSAFDQDVSYVFMGDGVFQLLKNQQPNNIEQKNLASSLAALTVYGIDKIFVDSDSLRQRNLSAEHLTIKAELVDSFQIQTLVNKADVVFNL